jgi:hypothetical protein
LSPPNPSGAEGPGLAQLYQRPHAGVEPSDLAAARQRGLDHQREETHDERQQHGHDASAHMAAEGIAEASDRRTRHAEAPFVSSAGRISMTSTRPVTFFKTRGPMGRQPHPRRSAIAFVVRACPPLARAASRAATLVTGPLAE